MSHLWIKERTSCSHPVLPEQPKPRNIDICVVILLTFHLPVGNLGRPIVGQTEELFQPLYVSDDLLDIHTVVSPLYHEE